MQQVKNIIFDLGGVVLDIDYNKTQMAFVNLGITHFHELFAQQNSSDVFAKLETGKISEESFYDEFRKETKKNLSNEQIETAWNAMLLDFTAERINLLEALGKKYNIFLFSNTNAIHHKFFHKKYFETFSKANFDSLFHKAYYSHIMGLRKPTPESFLYIIEEQKLGISETLFIDDTGINIEAAKKLGLQTKLLLAPETLLHLGL
jgi:haloacid dehalogenase superfamily, subfamily IA, variant 3 with third motif having DD or ED